VAVPAFRGADLYVRGCERAHSSLKRQRVEHRLHFGLLAAKSTRELWNGCSFEHTYRFEHVVAGHAQILGTGAMGDRPP